MLESRGQVAHGTGDLRVNGILLPAARRCMVGFIQNQERTSAKFPQPIAKRTGIVFIDQQTMGNEKTRMSAPGIDPEPTLAANALHVILVEDFKRQAETGFQLILP